MNPFRSSPISLRPNYKVHLSFIEEMSDTAVISQPKRRAVIFNNPCIEHNSSSSKKT